MICAVILADAGWRVPRLDGLFSGSQRLLISLWRCAWSRSAMDEDEWVRCAAHLETVKPRSLSH
jgi:hypothetical protein